MREAPHSMWQVAIAPMVEPGKYLFHVFGSSPPDVGPSYSVFETVTNSIFFAIRLMSVDEAERMRVLRAIRIYPYADRATSDETRIVAAGDERWAGSREVSPIFGVSRGSWSVSRWTNATSSSVLSLPKVGSRTGSRRSPIGRGSPTSGSIHLTGLATMGPVSELAFFG